jgi:hypothetical protein
MKEMIFSMVAVCSACAGFATQTEFPIQPEESKACVVQANDGELPSGELPPILEKCKKKK